MRTKRFNVVNLLFTSATCSTIAVVIFAQTNKYDADISLDAKLIPSEPISSCETVSHRLEGYKFIKPILYNNNECESGKYKKLKASIIGKIEQYRQSGRIDKVSVYLKLLSNREYISINESGMYHPASLMKLPILITFLEMEERNPGMLNKQITFHIPKDGLPVQAYNTHQIQAEKSYSIRDLLKYMIVYSDNNATYLLNNSIDLIAFRKMFSDLGLVVPDVSDMNYQLSAKDYSVFFNIIYNAGYLTIKNSAFASELLSKCDFKHGIQNGIPSNTNIIHKFGEWGDSNNPSLHQLSESGIIYLDNSPYLLTIMTQGKVLTKLPSVLSEISKTIYNYLKAENNNL